MRTVSSIVLVKLIVFREMVQFSFTKLQRRRVVFESWHLSFPIFLFNMSFEKKEQKFTRFFLKTKLFFRFFCKSILRWDIGVTGVSL